MDSCSGQLETKVMLKDNIESYGIIQSGATLQNSRRTPLFPVTMFDTIVLLVAHKNMTLYNCTIRKH